MRRVFLPSSLEQVRRSILRLHEEHVQQTLEEDAGCVPLENPVIVARCVVGAVFEVVCSWLEEPPDQRLPAEEVARVVSQYNQRALRGGK